MHYDRLWDPREYLEQYYRTGEVAEDEQRILGFVDTFLKEKGMTFDEMIEIGCGPTIHHILPFLPYVRRFHMADYVEDNLMEIRKWVSGAPDAHDWAPYIKGVLRIEGYKDASAYAATLTHFKSKLGGLSRCDVLSAHPLPLAKKFPLVVSFYCVDCATSSKGEWVQAMRNLSSLVAPDGWLILSALRNAKHYLVAGKEFPSANVDEDDMREALGANGYRPGSITVEVHPIAQWAAEGFSSIIAASAQKA